MDIKSLKAQVRSLATAVAAGTATDEQSVELDALVATLNKREADAERAARAVSLAADSEVVVEAEAPAAGSIGQTFVRNAKFNGRGSSERVAASFEMTRATTTGDIVVNPTLIKGATPAIKAPLTSLVSVVPVSTGDVSYVVESVTYPSTEFTAEGTTKPEITYATVATPVALGTMAGLVKVSRQALSDSAALAADIDNKVVQNIVRATETDIADTIAGASLATVTGASLLAAIRLAQAAVDEVYTSTAVALNPADAAAIDIAILNGTLNGAVVNGRIWGLQIVTSPLIGAGYAVVGDFANAIKFFNKGAVEVFTTDADGTDFQKNIITVLGEARGKAAVVAPSALRYATVAA